MRGRRCWRICRAPGGTAARSGCTGASGTRRAAICPAELRVVSQCRDAGKNVLRGRRAGPLGGASRGATDQPDGARKARGEEPMLKLTLNTKFVPGSNIRGDMACADWRFLLPSLDLAEGLCLGGPSINA